jgi:hypothetical protein
MTTTNREDWLSAAVSELRPFFDAVGAPSASERSGDLWFPIERQTLWCNR